MTFQSEESAFVRGADRLLGQRGVEPTPGSGARLYGECLSHPLQQCPSIGHEMAAEATSDMEASRESLRRYIGASSIEEIIFTSGTTMSINVVARSWGDAFLVKVMKSCYRDGASFEYRAVAAVG